MYIPMKSVGRMQAITAILMAYAVLLILVSPVVPSPLTTVRSRQVVHPPQFVTPASALLFTSAADSTRMFWLMEEPGRLLTSGSDIVDRTTARLC
jgi:choline-glycine betaine transporter